MKTNFNKKHSALIAAATLTLISVFGQATAAVTITSNVQASSDYPINTSNDLIFQASPISSAGDFTAGGGVSTTPTVLTDGIFGAWGSADASALSAAGGTGAGSELVYSLGSNSTGYNLTDIQTYSGWNDDGRYQQGYTVSYSVASAPTTFINLVTVPSTPSSTPGNNQEFIDLTTLGIDNVAAIKFDFNDVANGWTGYRELVINGTADTASTPEPSVAYLMLGGLVALVFAQRFLKQSNA